MQKPTHCQVIGITSGQPGVGKTTVSVNLAVALHDMGYTVMILDANSSSHNAQTALGTVCPFHLGHFLNGEKSLREIILKRRYGINLIAGASTIEAMTTLNPSKAARVLKQFGDLESELDFLIVDMPPGTEQSVLSFMASTSRRIVVVRNDQAGITDAYAMIKVLCSDFKLDEIHIIVNGVTTEAEGKKMFDVLDKISQRFLTRALHYLGSVSQDELIVDAGQHNFSVTEYAPTSRGARDFRQIASNTSHLALQKFVDGGIEHFIQRLLHLHDLTAEAA